MLSNLEFYYSDQTEPNGEALLALRQILLNFDSRMAESWKFSTPFFSINKINHPTLIKGNRKQVKVLYIDPQKDIPIETVHEILTLLMPYYLF